MDSDADLSNTWCSRASQFEDRMSPVDWGEREAMKPHSGGRCPSTLAQPFVLVQRSLTGLVGHFHTPLRWAPPTLAPRGSPGIRL